MSLCLLLFSIGKQDSHFLSEVVDTRMGFLRNTRDKMKFSPAKLRDNDLEFASVIETIKNDVVSLDSRKFIESNRWYFQGPWLPPFLPCPAFNFKDYSNSVVDSDYDRLFKQATDQVRDWFDLRHLDTDYPSNTCLVIQVSSLECPFYCSGEMDFLFSFMTH